MSGLTSATATATAPAKFHQNAMSPADREQMILEHLPQVRLIARRIRDQVPGLMSLDDMISNGTVGLISAIDRFDPTQGVKLRTFAEFKIRGAILDSLREQDVTPRRQRQRARTIREATGKVENRLQANAPLEEVAEQIGISLNEYHAWSLDSRRPTFEPLDTVVSDGEGSRMARQIAATGFETQPGKAIEVAQLRRVLADAIARMPRQERTVLSLMFHEDLSLREISRVLGLHESRVSQIKMQALGRMKELVEETWPRRGSSAKK
ncbi:MAG: FliA/WhiG family RNA polymerase sigma factor [Bryobacteraceae bacterium]|nr:FliA/WhiG family RNA polymerase sigma factor [Bryobacteraceae bacterium]